MPGRCHCNPLKYNLVELYAFFTGLLRKPAGFSEYLFIDGWDDLEVGIIQRSIDQWRIHMKRLVLLAVFTLCLVLPLTTLVVPAVHADSTTVIKDTETNNN